MKEIYDINIQRMNNGAHFTFVSNILARAAADTTVKGKASELISNFNPNRSLGFLCVVRQREIL